MEEEPGEVTLVTLGEVRSRAGDIAGAMGEKEPGGPRTDGSKFGRRQRVFIGAEWGGITPNVEGRGGAELKGGGAPISPIVGGRIAGDSLGGERVTANPFCTIKLLTSCPEASFTTAI